MSDVLETDHAETYGMGEEDLTDSSGAMPDKVYFNAAGTASVKWDPRLQAVVDVGRLGQRD